MKILDNESQSQGYQLLRNRGISVLAILSITAIGNIVGEFVVGPQVTTIPNLVTIFMVRGFFQSALSDIYILEREADFLEKVANDSIPYVQQFRDRRPIQVKK